MMPDGSGGGLHLRSGGTTSVCMSEAYSDPFREARETAGVMKCPFHGEDITMLLRHEDVRKAAKDWETFSSDAPFRVPIPSEEAVRTMRQLPIETDPPSHSDYREIVEPFFQRAKDPGVIANIEALISGMIDSALKEDRVQDGLKKGDALEEYLHQRFDEAERTPGKDFFSALAHGTFQGRRLTREEAMGFANLAFAGGRDTIIHTISCAIGHLAEHPEALRFLKEDPKRITLASEEFFRVFMPLTQIGRVCPEEVNLHGVTVPAGARIGLCWSSANFDETAFPDAFSVKLDRKPNPHLSFGFGTHLCLGAPHARLVLRTLLRALCDKVGQIETLGSSLRAEHEAAFTRTLGYESLEVRLRPVAT